MANTKNVYGGFSKRYDELEFTDNFMFCKVLQTNPDLCKELIELILERKIGKIISIDREQSIEMTTDGRGIRFDVSLEDDEDSLYDVEMQTIYFKDLPRRFRYYQGMRDLEQSERGMRYREFKKSVIIFICLDNPYPEIGRHKYTFRKACLEEPGLIMDDGTAHIILAAKGDIDDVSSDLQAFLDYLLDHTTKTNLTYRLEQQVEKARARNENWRREYMTLQDIVELRLGDKLALLEALQEEADHLQLEVEAAKTEVEAAKTEVEAAKIEAEAAKTEVEAAKTEVEVAKTEAEAAKTEAEAAKTEAEAAKTEVETANAEKEAMKAEIAQLQKRIRELES